MAPLRGVSKETPSRNTGSRGAQAWGAVPEHVQYHSRMSKLSDLLRRSGAFGDFSEPGSRARRQNREPSSEVEAVTTAVSPADMRPTRHL